ncbi:FeoB-associated Cys-rich membrane protein [Paraclostridium bifermentans]|nr:FeoB-associated Cys-rich membrane protein [Paraclostridium bifermentans]
MISAVYQFVLAWIVAFIVKTLGSLAFEGASASSLVELLVGGIIVLAAAFILYKNVKAKGNGCSGCSGCSSSGSCPSSKNKMTS